MKRVQFVSCTVSVGVLLLVLLTIPIVQEKISQEVLKRDAQLLLYQLHDDLVDAFKVKQKVYDTVTKGCTGETSNHLEKFVLEHPSVRWIGVDDYKMRHCSNTNTKLTFAHSHQTSINNDSYLAFTTNELLGEGLALISESQYFKLLILLDPLLIQFMHEFTCTACLSYRLSVMNDANPQVDSSSQEESYKTKVSAVREENGVSLRLELLAKADFVALYFSHSLLLVVVLGLTLASLSYFLTKNFLSVRLSIERLIKEGIKNQEFIPYYQPIVNSETKEIQGAELLVRWQRKDGSIVPPGQFIEAAEQSKLILPITEQLLIAACEDIKKFGWDATRKYISINLVPDQINDTRFFNFTQQRISASGVNAYNLSLELTERRPVSDLANAKKVLSLFTDLGVDIKLDDAGTGFGAFSYIQELGINTLKIDKMFVDTILHKEDLKSPVLESIIAFGKTSNMHLIAEGVENKQQVEFLASEGVFDIQGYYYGKPMNADHFEKWMNERR